MSDQPRAVIEKDKRVMEEIDLREGIRDLDILEKEADAPLPEEAQARFVEDQIREQAVEVEAVSTFEGVEVAEQE